MATESQFTISPSKCSANVRDKAVLPLAVGPSTTTSSGSQPTSAGTPRNVMPVTCERDHHDQRGDDQKARGFQRIDMGARMLRRVRPALGGGDGHEHIVAPREC